MKSKQQDFRTEKYIRYGIRKYSLGVASVAISAGLMFLGNGAVSAMELQGADTRLVSTSTLNTESSTETKTPENSIKKEKEVALKTVDKTDLVKKITELEEKVKTAKNIDDLVLTSAKELLVSAKSVISKEIVEQEEVDTELAKIKELITVFAESVEVGKITESTEKAEETKETKETVVPVQEAKKILEQVTSEAEVTNVLATEAVRKNKVEGENKAPIEAAVANNKGVIAETKKVLANDALTAKQINDQLSRLNDSILAVYNDLKKQELEMTGTLE